MSHGLSVTLSTITGSFLLIIWALLLVVTVRHCFCRRPITKAKVDLALMALGQRHREESAFPLRVGPVIALGLLGARLWRWHHHAGYLGPAG